MVLIKRNVKIRGMHILRTYIRIEASAIRHSITCEGIQFAGDVFIYRAAGNVDI